MLKTTSTNEKWFPLRFNIWLVWSLSENLVITSLDFVLFTSSLNYLPFRLVIFYLLTLYAFFLFKMPLSKLNSIVFYLEQPHLFFVDLFNHRNRYILFFFDIYLIVWLTSFHKRCILDVCLHIPLPPDKFIICFIRTILSIFVSDQLIL